MTQSTIALLAFLFPLAYSPGPGNMFFAATGARFGFRATLRANAGYHLATWVVTVAIGLGFAAVIERSPAALDALTWAGSAFVLCLAWRLVRAGPVDGMPGAGPAGLVQGAILLVLNPKAYAIIAAMFSQFLAGGGPGRAEAVVWIASVFTLNNLVAFVVWTLVGDRIAARFRDRAAARRLNAALGLSLAGVAVWMVVA